MNFLVKLLNTLAYKVYKFSLLFLLLLGGLLAQVNLGFLGSGSIRPSLPLVVRLLLKDKLHLLVDALLDLGRCILVEDIQARFDEPLAGLPVPADPAECLYQDPPAG